MPQEKRPAGVGTHRAIAEGARQEGARRPTPGPLRHTSSSTGAGGGGGLPSTSKCIAWEYQRHSPQVWFRHSNPPLEGRENPAYSSPGRTFSPNLRRASCRYLCPLGPEARQPRSPSRGGPAGAVPPAAAQYLSPTRSGRRSATHEASLALNPVSFFSLHLWQLTYFTALDLLSSSISESDTKASVSPQKKKGHMPGTHIHTPWESRPRPPSTKGGTCFLLPVPPK